jgi:putative transposase
MYFVTICCQSRSVNHLCRESAADVLFETARRYHVAEQCYFYLLLLMPDHLHGLISIRGDIELANLVRNFKRITARLGGIRWQRNFFDHRLRQNESLTVKGAYIRANPVRAGLVGSEEDWAYTRSFADFDREVVPRAGD